MKESIDLKTLHSININVDDCLEICLNNGDKLLYKGPDLHVWLGTITIRADWAQDKIKAPSYSDINDPNRTSSEASTNATSSM